MLCLCHFPLSLATKLSSFPFPSLLSSYDTLFPSIHLLLLLSEPLHLWDDECVSSHTLTCRPSDLELFVYLAHALSTRTYENTYTDTRSIPLCTLCLMLSL